MTIEEKARELLADAGYVGAAQNQRVRALAAVFEDHPTAWLERCADERTGERYGRAACRAGRAQKIGYTIPRGARSPRGYQLWAVWE